MTRQQIDIRNMTQRERAEAFRSALRQRVLVLDGSLGVQIQRMLATGGGNVDFLNINRPDIVASVHRGYLEAGADIIETNTFNSNALSQREYALQHRVAEMNAEGVRIARAEAMAAMQADPSRIRFVAGSMGPTSMAASLPNDVDDPTLRAVSFGELEEAAREQAGALADAGADMILLETVFDALNVKAQMSGIRKALDERNLDLPVIVSLTLSDASGRLLSGHTVEAMIPVLECFRPDALGCNCGAGPESLTGHIRRLAALSPWPVIFYPNAGLPDRMGNYSQTPSVFADAIRPLAEEGLLNIVGGCCGTTPEHIRCLASVTPGAAPHVPADAARPWLAGLEAFHADRGFINVGERCNVAGSRKFLRLIKEKNDTEALAIARHQVENGAMVLDINVDDGMLDSVAEMRHFLRLLGSDPTTSSMPWMIDSSSFDVIKEALHNVPGKPIVNSISLKHGEEEFMHQAGVIRSLGAAVVVMAFDEQGQADTFERKIEICRRAYRLLVENAGFDPQDIIFDPNVLTVATGMPEHDRYGVDFIEAVRWIKSNLPGARTSGGVSNLSFAFRGNNFVRQSMHAAFLYHAVAAGLDMAIIDPGAKVTYSDIPAELLEAVEDVILARRPDAAERLTAIAGNYSKDAVAAGPQEKQRPENVDERLQQALMSGDDSELEHDLREALTVHASANAIVEGPLMKGMERVGALFEQGKMFLPQVVKSARVMHRAVEILKPVMEADSSKGNVKGRVLMATVKGDVHDIGKNIAAVVMRCNNYEVVDLGVQVDAATIVRETQRLRPDFIGLSGLISPSLDEMADVASELQRAGLSVPLLLGGAATSDLHTAVKIAPLYDGIVLRVADAARNPVAAARIMADPVGEKERIDNMHRALRESILKDDGATVRPSVPAAVWTEEEIARPRILDKIVMDHISIQDVRPFINWVYFHACWRTPKSTLEGRRIRREAESLLDDMEAAGCVLRAMVRILPAYGDPQNDRLVVNGVEIPTPRQRALPSRGETLSLSDFVAPEGYGDHAGVFMVTIGDRLREITENEKDEYRRLLCQSVCDRLAEAASEWLHRKVRTEIWGYAPDEPLDMAMIRHAQYRGIRPAVGYPSLPDQSVMHLLAKLTDPADIDVSVTVNGALSPSSSVAGFYIAAAKARYFTL